MKTLSFQIDDKFLKQAKEKAAKLSRSLSGQIRYLLRKFVEDEN